MIVFKKLRWQNLLSTGNQFTEILLNRSKSTLIVGENGAGKSTILDALSFAMYGRAFRNINKAQLINSITGKGMLIELEFSIGQKEYLIRRGIKPNIFEIYQDSQLLNQQADAREQQDFLERQILKLNHKSFGQIVVLGSANFVPFMQLSAQERRTVIEDLLDIQIFTTMNSLLKEKVSDNRSSIQDSDYQIALLEQKIDLGEKHIDSIRTNIDDLIKTKQELIEELDLSVSSTSHLVDQTMTSIAELSQQIEDQDKVTTRKSKLLQMEKDLEAKVKKFKKEIDFFHDHDNCPTCKQGIDHDFKEQWVTARNSKTDEITSAMTQIETEITNLEARLEEIRAVNAKITALNQQCTNYNADIRSWQKSIDTIKQEIESIRNNTKTIDDNSDQVTAARKELKLLSGRKIELIEQREILEVSGVLLKDGGIKTKIIKQFVPIMNKLINKYLAAMDFFVQFELDEKFNETIKSRFRDEFTYASFSEGEKMRIDLALMFTWRAIAKLRNSASTNLLIMDEVFDSSLDSAGTEEFMKILDTLAQDTNTFVISHKGDQLYDKFHSVIKFEKHANFSRMAI